jgi:signal transduction histidine kinase
MVNYQVDASNELAALYKETGEWQKAYDYLQTASQLKDSLDLAGQIQQTNELKEKFETQKKEQEISLLTANNKLIQAESKRSRLLQYIFIFLFIAALSIAWLVLNRFKIKRRLQEQLLRNQIAADLHDDIGSTLSSIDISSRIALLKKEDDRLVTEQLKKIQSNSRNMMDSMSDIVWSINPNNDNFDRILLRMKEFAGEILEPAGIQYHFTEIGNPGTLQFNTADRKDIYLIFKEALNNAAKYSEAKNIGIQLVKEGHFFRMQVADNGKGFNAAGNHSGNGIKNLYLRAHHLKAQVSIESQSGKGTLIEVKIPLT